MKKILLLLFIISFFLFPKTAFAHELATDGAIGVIFHTDPDDDPIAGQPTAFFFEIKDKQNKFSFEKCQCILTVNEHGKIINTQAITSEPSIYTFPKKDIYQIIFSGQPKKKDDFQKFSVKYEVQVTHESKTQTEKRSSTNSLPFSLIIKTGIIFLLILCVILFFIKKKNNSQDTNNEQNNR